MQLWDKSIAPIKKWPLDGILTSIRLIEDLLKGNSKMFLRPLMFSQIPAEDQLMIEWFPKNPHFKMPTKYSIDFSGKMKWSMKRKKSSSKLISQAERKTIIKFLVSIKMPLWRKSPMPIENFLLSIIQKQIQTTKKLPESLWKLTRLFKLFPTKLTDQPTIHWLSDKLYPEELLTYLKTSSKTNGWTYLQKLSFSNLFSEAAEEDHWFLRCGVKAAETLQDFLCSEPVVWVEWIWKV